MLYVFKELVNVFKIVSTHFVLQYRSLANVKRFHFAPILKPILKFFYYSVVASLWCTNSNSPVRHKHGCFCNFFALDFFFFLSYTLIQSFFFYQYKQIRLNMFRVSNYTSKKSKHFLELANRALHDGFKKWQHIKQKINHNEYVFQEEHIMLFSCVFIYFTSCVFILSLAHNTILKTGGRAWMSESLHSGGVNERLVNNSQTLETFKVMIIG